MSKKTKLAFWLVSHCKTNNHRLEYAQELQRYMPLDIFFLALSDHNDLTRRTLLSKEPNISKKTKLAFWLVSHCKTDNHRLEYAKELQKYMPIDIYGKCGPLNCTAGNQGFANLAPAYKFYLAFENSNCFEYITG